MTTRLARLTLGCCVAVICRNAMAKALPPEIDAVRKFLLEREYPDLFDKPSRTKIENALLADLDGDGALEVVLHVMPHYRQSATIVVFRLDKELAVTRVKEGLAPGPLVPLSGAFLDSHSIGYAVDLTLKGTPEKPLSAEQRDKFIDIALKKFVGVVEYPTFIHADSRRGAAAYVDMRHVSNPPSKLTCSDFEFSKVDSVVAGTTPSSGRKELLAALVAESIYIYRVTSFLSSGLIEKNVSVLKTPPDFAGLVRTTAGRLGYQNKTGEVKELSVNE